MRISRTIIEISHTGIGLISSWFSHHKLKFLLVAIFLPPIVLALPFHLPFHQQHFSAQLILNATTTKNLSLDTNFAPLGGTILSEVLNIKTDDMPGYVYLSNDSEIYANSQTIKPPPPGFAPEEGLMLVPLFENGTTTSISIPIASSTRHYFQAGEVGPAELGSEIQVRAVPLGIVASSTQISSTTIEVGVYLTTVLFKLSGYEGYDWSWNIYWHNLLLISLGWAILLAALMQIFAPFSKVKNGKL